MQESVVQVQHKYELALAQDLFLLVLDQTLPVLSVLLHAGRGIGKDRKITVGVQLG